MPLAVPAAGDVCAVIVTYNPDPDRLAAALHVLAGAVARAVIVDNASAQLAEEALRARFPGLILKRLPENRGVGAAQNEGFSVARGLACSHVLLLDQDSLPSHAMVSNLRHALETLQAAGQKVACVGPRFKLSTGSELSGFARLGWLGLRPMPCPHETAAVECDFLVSSGSLVPIDVVDRIGGMEEGLFIDQVDTEWCLRARSRGYRVFGACGAIMEHRLGEAHSRIWAGRWRYLPRHRPFRYYYIFRNSLLLSRRKYAPAKWIWYQAQYLAALLLRYGIFGRAGELRMMLKGIVHGIRRTEGKLELRLERGSE